MLTICQSFSFFNQVKPRHWWFWEHVCMLGVIPQITRSLSLRAAWGNSLAVQWLGLQVAFTAVAQVQFLVRELRSHKPCNAAKKKPKKWAAIAQAHLAPCTGFPGGYLSFFVWIMSLLFLIKYNTSVCYRKFGKYRQVKIRKCKSLIIPRVMVFQMIYFKSHCPKEDQWDVIT